METYTYNVLVFRTDVTSSMDAETILQAIKKHYPNHIVFFDLMQSEKILWVEGWNTKALIIIDALIQFGYNCEFLKD